MKKILVLGATGMAGHIIYHSLKEKGEFQMFNITYRNKLTEDSLITDVRNTNDFLNKIKIISPDIVINCIGLLIRESKNIHSNSIFLNAFFPNFLAEISKELNFKLIHISTDCVFSGKSGNYTEASFRDADDIYGRSKALGEIIDNRNVTLRTSIVGPELKENGEGLFDWFMHQENHINGYVNAYWSGITTLQLANSIYLAIISDLTGLFHVTNGVKISKYDLLILLNKVFRNELIEIRANGSYSVDKSLVASDKFDFAIPGYDVMFNELRIWMKMFDFYTYSI